MEAEDLSSDDLVETLSRECDAAMPRQSLPRNKRKPVYWWWPEIAELLASCLRVRWRMQRARTDVCRMKRSKTYSVAKLALNKQIKKARKRACFEILRHAASTTPWGDAYRVVMTKTKVPQNTPEMLLSTTDYSVEAAVYTESPVWDF